jgi:hypothetical protein
VGHGGLARLPPGEPAAHHRRRRGSNGYRSRLWKRELGSLAERTGLAVTVCHLPPGTSKWNRIEHRLFSHISMNWRGRPLVSHEVVVQLIGTTTTRTGLKVRAELDPDSYRPASRSPTPNSPPPLTGHAFHGEWNYTITPSPSSPHPNHVIRARGLSPPASFVWSRWKRRVLVRGAHPDPTIARSARH